MQDLPFCSYFLFINSSSGGGVGAKLIEQQAQKISFEISLNQTTNDNKKKFDIYFYNLKTNRQKGFTQLKSLTQKNITTKVIICGGDGSVVWVVSQFFKYNIQTDKVPIGIIPLGTGNDFSQYLGWGKLKTTLTQNSFKSLKKLIRKWEKAKIQNFDIWDVKAQVFQHGKFQKVQNSKNKQIQGKVFQRSFCNYFSFGIDGKIGYSFDLHRTTSRFGNLAMYGIMGMLKAMTKTKTISQLIHGMQIKYEEQKSDNYQIYIKKSPTKSQIKKQEVKDQNSNNNTRSKFIFQTKKDKSLKDIVNMKNDSYTIVALNINSFMGGVFDIWKNAKNAIQNQESKNFKPMDSGDGALQFISFSSSLGMAAERSIGGFGQRVTQGGGPYYFSFKQYHSKQKHRTYLQVDGQFIRCSHPKSVEIQHSIYGNKGKIKVLRNVEQKE